MENTEKYNRYLLGLLNVFHRHQFERSELIPKVYKLLTLYYSLGRYCNLSEIQLRFLHQPGSIYIEEEGKPLEAIMNKLNASDKKKLQ
jgi:hypothetical protein